MTPLKSLTLSLEEVKELLTSEEGTGVKRKEEAVTLQIPPMYGANIRMGVKRELDAMSSRYSSQLGGIPMAWEKIHLPSTGALIGTSPYIHISVYGTFYIFSPKINDSLQGTIKNKSPNYLSCLVHRIFNVFVPRPDEISAQEWVGSTLEEGDVIKIGVTNIDMSLYLPMITGRLESVVARKLTPSVVSISESPMGKVFTDTKISSSEEEEEEEEEVEEEEIRGPVAKETKLLLKKTKAAAKKTRDLTKHEKQKVKMKSLGGKKAKKKKEVKRAKEKLKEAVSFFANSVGDSPTKKEKKKNLALREAEYDTLFLSSLLAEDAARGITSSSSSQRVSKKQKAEEEEEEEEEEIRVPVAKETKLLPKKTKAASKKTRVLTKNEKKLKMRSPGGEKAKKKKEVKRAKKKLKAVSFFANRVGDSPTKKEKNQALREAELDALFLSSLLAEDAARGITSSSSSQRVSKKQKAEDDGSKNKMKRRLYF